MYRKVLTSVALFVAAALCVSAQSLPRGRAQECLMNAVDLLEQGKAAAALDSLQTAAAADSALAASNDAYLYYSGRCYAALEQSEKAEQCFRRAIALDSTNVWYHESLIAVLDEQGRTYEAAEHIRGIIDRFPSSFRTPYVLTMLGNLEADSGNTQKAVEYFDEALRMDPGYAQASVAKADLYYVRGNYAAFFTAIDPFARNPYVYSEAKAEILQTIIKNLKPQVYRVWHVQIDSLIAVSAAAHPGDSTMLILAGGWFYSTGQEEKGTQYFAENVAFNPEDIGAHRYMLAIRHQQKDYDAAIDECETIIKLARKQGSKSVEANMHTVIGDYQYQKGNHRKAYQEYEKSLSINPDDASALNNYAYYLSLNGEQLKKAETMSRHSLELEPDNDTFLDTLGWILHLQGRDKEAKNIFKKAIIHGGTSSSTVLRHYTTVLQALGEDRLADYYNQMADKAEEREQQQ